MSQKRNLDKYKEKVKLDVMQKDGLNLQIKEQQRWWL